MNEIKERTWADQYEKVLEFFFWEPQHLGRRSPREGPPVKFSDVADGLRRKEVPLNHLFDIFLSLAPTPLIARFCRSLDPDAEVGAPQLEYARDDQAFEVCQPDLWLRDGERQIFIELKVGSKLTAEQVVRYAAFAASLPSEERREVSFVLLSPTGRSPALAEFEAARFDLDPIAEKVIRKADRYGMPPEHVRQVAAQMRVGAASFADAIRALRGERDRLGGTEAEETVGRLLAGMIAGLERYLA